MPPQATDPKKIQSGKVDLSAKRIGSSQDAYGQRHLWHLENYKPMRYDGTRRGPVPKGATGLPGSSTSKKRKSTDGDSSGPAAKKSKSNRGDANDQPDPLDVSDISLDDDDQLDDEDQVCVFDTCDTIRSKIRKFLTRFESEGVTQAAFLRAITKAAFAETEPHRKITSAQLVSFMGQRGTMTGNLTGVYYAAYVFFEKLRIKEGKSKSADREIIEGYHVHGLDRSLAPENLWFLVPFRAKGITMDKYARPNVYYGYDWKGNPDGYDKDNIPDPKKQYKRLQRQYEELEETGKWTLPDGFPLPSRS